MRGRVTVTDRAEIISHSEKNWRLLHDNSRVVTASQAATILGRTPYGTPHDLWMRKTGRAPAKEATVAMRRGSALEPFIAGLYEEQTRHELVDLGEFTCVHAPAQGDSCRVVVTPDRFDMTGVLVEIKAPARLPSAAAYETYIVQLNLQMWATGWHRGVIAMLAGNDFIVSPPYLLTDEMVDEIEGEWLPMFDKFMECCVTDTPPDWGKRASKDEKRPFVEGVSQKRSIERLAAEYMLLQKMGKDVRDQQADVRRDLVKALDGRSCGAAGPYVVELIRAQRKGLLRVESSEANRMLLENQGVEYDVVESSGSSRLKVTKQEEIAHGKSEDKSEGGGI